jgi:hypothetical protein
MLARILARLQNSDVRRMMYRYDYRSRKCFTLHAGKRGFQKCYLHVGDIGVKTVLGGNDAGVFEGVAVEAEDTHERRFE